jgi:hypothetical protein
MSRLASLSPETLKSLFSPDSDSTLICLLTITYGSGVNSVVRIADNYISRIESLTTDADVVYGVTSNSKNYLFIPFELSLPQEERDQVPQCTLTINDVTQYLTEIIREQFEIVPRVKLELVLSKTPNVVEVTFDGLYVTNISYNKDQVILTLEMIDFSKEPFPQHRFVPQYFPGLF